MKVIAGTSMRSFVTGVRAFIATDSRALFGADGEARADGGPCKDDAVRADTGTRAGDVARADCGMNHSGMFYTLEGGAMAFALDDQSAAGGNLTDVDERDGMLLPRNAELRGRAIARKVPVSLIGELALHCHESVSSQSASPGGWPDEVMLSFDDARSMREIALLLLGNAESRIECCHTDHPDHRYVFRVSNVSPYALLFCQGEGKARVFNRAGSGDALTDWFVPFGRIYGFIGTDFPDPMGDVPGFRILSPDGSCAILGPELFTEIGNVLDVDFNAVRPPAVPANAGEFSLRIAARLKKADAVQTRSLPREELWIVPHGLFDRFSSDLYCPESALRGLEALAVHIGGEPCLAVWNGGAGDKGPDVSFSSLAHPQVSRFYRMSGLSDPLFLPAGFVLHPRIEEATLRAIFGLNARSFVVVAGPEESPSVIELDASLFRSVRKALVDYVFLADRERAEKLYSNPLYDFGTFEGAADTEVAEQHDEIAVAADDRADDHIACDASAIATESTSISDGNARADDDRAGEKLADGNIPGDLEDGVDVVPDGAGRHDEDSPGVDASETPAEPDDSAAIVIPESLPPFKSGEETIAKKAAEYIDRYERLNAEDWRKYMTTASMFSQLGGDARAALASMLFLARNPSDLDSICLALGLTEDDQDRLWAGSLESSLRKLFGGDWRSERPDAILLKLHTLAERFGLRQGYIVRDASLRSSLRDLGSLIVAAGNPKCIWLFGLVEGKLCGDALSAEEARLAVQNVLADASADFGIPRAIRREAGRRHLERYRDGLSKNIRLFRLSPHRRAWAEALVSFMLVRMDFLFLGPAQIDAMRAATPGEQLGRFLEFLRRISACPHGHPGECSVLSHLGPTDVDLREFLATAISGTAFPPGPARTGLDDADSVSRLGRLIAGMEFPEGSPWPFLESIRAACAMCREPGAAPEAELLSRKIESWSRNLESGTERAALRVLAGSLSGQDAEEETATRSLESIRDAGTPAAERRRLAVLVLRSVGADLFEKNIARFADAISSGGLLGDDDESLDPDEFSLLYVIVSSVLAAFARKESDYSRIVSVERKKIRDVILGKGKENG